MPDTTTDNPSIIPSHTSPAKKPRKPKKAVNVRAVIATKLENPKLTTRELSAIHGSDHGSIARVLKRYGVTAALAEDFKTHRADILAGLQHKIVDSITTADLKKANLQSKVVSVGILFDKERLERGQSTHNLAHLFSLAEVDE